jgi:hypothetical protein
MPHADMQLLSRYAMDATMSRYQDFGFRGAITKPYEAGELGRNRPRSYRIRADKSRA